MLFMLGKSAFLSASFCSTECDCDECGTYRCDHETGNCECKPNTEYPKCDRCIVSTFSLFKITVLTEYFRVMLHVFFRKTTGASEAALDVSHATVGPLPGGTVVTNRLDSVTVNQVLVD